MNIVLLCAGGMSSSFLARRIQEAGDKSGFECTVKAYGIPDAERVIPDADIVLIGPQVRYNLSRLQSDYPHKEISVIAMNDYGTMNGEKIMNDIINAFKKVSL